MKIFKNFTLVKGKYYLREEIEEFRDGILREFQKVQTDNRLNHLILEQVTNVLEEMEIDTKEPHQLAMVLRQKLNQVEEVNALQEELETCKQALSEYREKEDIIQKSILQAQKAAEEITEKARREETEMIENARQEAAQIREEAQEKAAQVMAELQEKEQQINRKLNEDLNSIIVEQFAAVKKVNEELENIDKQLLGWLKQRLSILESNRDFAHIKDHAQNIEDFIKQFSEEINTVTE